MTKLSEGARKSNFTIGMGQKNSMITSSKTALDKFVEKRDNSNIKVPSSINNKQASKNANWNHGYQTVNYVSTNKE